MNIYNILNKGYVRLLCFSHTKVCNHNRVSTRIGSWLPSTEVFFLVNKKQVSSKSYHNLRRALLAIRILIHSYAKVNGTFSIHFTQPFHFRPCVTSVHAELPAALYFMAFLKGICQLTARNFKKSATLEIFKCPFRIV
jgi:hypothetical protein